jgi:gluconate 2-dehydrogenase gamma chain
MKSAGRNKESCAWTGHYATFFGQLLENVREGYFADPLYGSNPGMAFCKWIGFPGARADFADWIDQAWQKYPYGPVAISGARD